LGSFDFFQSEQRAIVAHFVSATRCWTGWERPGRFKFGPGSQRNESKGPRSLTSDDQCGNLDNVARASDVCGSHARTGASVAERPVRESTMWLSTITGFGYVISAPRQTLYYNMRHTVSVSSAPCCVPSCPSPWPLASQHQVRPRTQYCGWERGMLPWRQGPLTSAIQGLNSNVNETEQAPSISCNLLRRNPKVLRRPP
jgi:hypothetical protein